MWSTTAAKAGQDAPKQSVALDAVEIFGLCSLVIAQPVLRLIESYPQVLISRHFQIRGTAYILLLVWLLPPVVLLSLELLPLLLRWKRAHRTLHLVNLFLLFVLFGQLLMKQLGINYAGDYVSIGGAVATGTLCVFFYARSGTAQTFLRLLSFSIVVVPGLFLMNPSIRKIYSPPPEPVFPKVHSQANVVLVIFDEFSGASLMDSERNIDSVRFPHFASLLNHFTWFPNATGVADETMWAVPAILTGKFPQMEKSASISDYPENLFSFLEPSYDLKVFESVTNLCPRRFEEKIEYRGSALDMVAIYLQLIVPDGYAYRFPSIGGKWSDFFENPATTKKDSAEKRFHKFLGSMQAGSKSTLYFVHIVLPHSPWYLLPSGKKYDFQGVGPMGIAAVSTSHVWGNDYWPMISGLQRYLLELGYIDKLVGELMETLQSKGLFDSSLIILTADHGLSFQLLESRRKLSRANCADVMSVPLFIKVPDQQSGSIDHRNIETIDILPTITDALETEAKWDVEGISALDPNASPRTTKKILRAMRGGGYLRTSPEIVKSSKTLEIEADLGMFQVPFEQIFAVGPAPELIGHSLQNLSPKRDGSFVLKLNFPERYRSIDPESAIVPALISGRIYCKANKPFTIAISVRDVVRATTQTFLPYRAPYGFGLIRDPAGVGVHHFVAMVPETSFRSGRNQIQVLVLPESHGPKILLAENQDPN